MWCEGGFVFAFLARTTDVVGGGGPCVRENEGGCSRCIWEGVMIRHLHCIAWDGRFGLDGGEGYGRVFSCGEEKGRCRCMID